MTVLDDELLRAALRELADSFEVSEEATERILAAQRGLSGLPAPPTPSNPTIGSWAVGPQSWPRRHKVLSVAALVLVLLAGFTIAGLLAGGHRSGVTSSALPTTPRTPGVSHGSASTSVPGRSTSLGGKSSGSARAGASTLSPTPVQTTPTTIPPLPSGAVGQPTKIQQSGSLSLTVPKGDTEATLTRLTNLATGSGGYVVNVQSQADGAGSPPGGTLTMQVPETSFQTVVSQAQHLGRVTSVSTKATDVTGQYVDLQARINALEASRQQYLTILSKATSIGDILAVQSQLDSLQSQLEQLQSQLQLLDNQTTYSTLTVSVSERGNHSVPAPSTSSLGQAWHDSVHGFIVGAEGLLSAAGPVLFVVLCVAAFVVLVRLGWRTWQRRRI